MLTKKHLSLSLLIITGILFFSCSNNDSNSQNIFGELNNWTIKTYNSTNELTAFNEYLIFNNRILKSIVYNKEDNFESSFSETEYTYDNERLVKMRDFYFGNFGLNDSETTFIYDDNGSLLKYETYILTTNIVHKVSFEHNGNNTIITRLKSIDNGQTFEPINFGSVIELTFDNNDNLILTKPPGAIGSNVNYIDTIEYTYDDLNLIKVSKYPGTELNYTYSNNKNPISLVYINTFSKKGFSLIKSPNNLLFQDNIAPNVLKSLNGKGIGEYTINNTFNSNTLIKMNISIDTFSDGSIDTRIVNEFTYE